MTDKGKIRKNFSLFRKTTRPHHFDASKKTIITDPEGSYTGIPLNSNGERDFNDMYPTQDADDL